eukprot:1679092-Amphidinium_carterae.1
MHFHAILDASLHVPSRTCMVAASLFSGFFHSTHSAAHLTAATLCEVQQHSHEYRWRLIVQGSGSGKQASRMHIASGR